MTDPQQSCSGNKRLTDMTTLHPLIAKMTPEEFGRHIFRWGMQSFPLSVEKFKIEMNKAVSQVVERQKLSDATIESLRAEVERLKKQINPVVHDVEKFYAEDSVAETHHACTDNKCEECKLALAQHQEVVSIYEDVCERNNKEISRLKEILKGRDEALKNYREIVRNFLAEIYAHVPEEQWHNPPVYEALKCLQDCNIAYDKAKQALSKTWEEGGMSCKRCPTGDHPCKCYICEHPGSLEAYKAGPIDKIIGLILTIKLCNAHATELDEWQKKKGMENSTVAE